MSIELKAYIERFCRLAVTLLVLTAVAKAATASGEARILGQADPLFGLLTMRQSMLLAAAVEMVVVVLVLRAPDILRKAVLLLWIGSVESVLRGKQNSFLHYRATGEYPRLLPAERRPTYSAALASDRTV